jgi:hypothetical protein|tara:strand:- start:1492 stop:1995 length:504 start_codon:yes stop_codon:yes gene_type:complete
MTTIVRHLVNDVDSSSYTFSTDRLETTILVAAQLMIMNVDFNNTYDINVETSTLSPDPTDTDTKDDPFIALACLRAACIIVGSEIRKESGNAISIKDGPSAIDLRGVTSTLIVIYQDLCKKYEEALLDYRAGNSVSGQSILGPYSPGSNYIRRGMYSDNRSGGYFNH